MKSSETKFLVKRAQGHDKDAFTELMQLQMKDMYRTAIAILMNEEDAADALQDTILTCFVFKIGLCIIKKAGEIHITKIIDFYI